MDNLKQLAVRTYSWTRALVHNGLAMFGFLAVIALLLGARPVLERAPSAASAPAAFGTIHHDAISLSPAITDEEDPQHRALAVYLSRKYKVALGAAEQFVEVAHDAGDRLDMDPLLILAVMAVESRFNPVAESVMGAKGLMQVIPKFHQDKIDEVGGDDSVLDPMTNVLVGTRILKDAMRRGGGLMRGLQLYAGAFSDDGFQYAQKVVAEKERLQQARKRAQPPAHA